MKKQVTKIALALSLISGFAGFAQQKAIQPCDTYAAMEERFKANPEARKDFEASQKVLEILQSQFEANQASGKIAAFEYTVPVVFHILHTGGSENITDAQCIAALAQVNSDYSRLGADTNSIFAPFKSLYIKSDIKFMLAHKDPTGNCTNGIVHTYDPRTLWDRSGNLTALYAGIIWNPTKYLNIIIVKDIVAQAGQNGTVIGYTYVPGTWGIGSPLDAIVYRSTYLGGYDARSLSHEIGHWLNLIHTFGNTNNPGVVCGSTSGGDNVSDTPDTKGNFSTCPASSTNTNYICTAPNPTNSANYYQNVENIMDYSSCPKNFTFGQTTRMRTALTSTISNRQNLWQPINLVATDVNGVIPCAPIAKFLSATGSYTVCTGGSIQMKDFTYNGTPSSYQWGVDVGGIIATPTSSNTSITFTIVGTSIVTLTVSNAQGSSTDTQTVTVIDGSAAITGPYMESFEGGGVPNNWEVQNIGNDAVTWAQTPSAAYDQAYSYFIDGPSNPANSIDMLQMPMMDVLHNQSNVFEFAYAYRQSSSGQNDKLKIQGSKDCGGTWSDIYVMSAALMAANSGGVSADPFYPATNEWKVYPISTHPGWSAYKNSASVLIRFNFIEGTGGNGNNIYIDAVNFYSLTGVNELTKSILLNLYPNPTNGETNLNFSLNDAANVKINVLDVMGREVLPIIENHYGPGEQTLIINKDNSLAPGIYFVNLSLNGAKMSSKLIIR